MIKKYAFYLIRWQLSTPILAIVLILLANIPTLTATIIANLIGGLIFFWIDRFIFRSLSKDPLWEIRDDIECADCGRQGRGYRIAEWLNYNRRQDKKPQFRCEECKDKKTLKKINDLIKSIERDGESKGLGKPEALKGNMSGYYSRHIDEKNRLIYRVTDVIEIAACREHYA